MPKLQLLVTHTHAGIVYPAGHVLDVEEHIARWLIDRRIGTKISGDLAHVNDLTKPVKTRNTKPKE